jgi:hypothetical protein
MNPIVFPSLLAHPGRTHSHHTHVSHISTIVAQEVTRLLPQAAAPLHSPPMNAIVFPSLLARPGHTHSHRRHACLAALQTILGGTNPREGGGGVFLARVT